MGTSPKHGLGHYEPQAARHLTRGLQRCSTHVKGRSMSHVHGHAAHQCHQRQPHTTGAEIPMPAQRPRRPWRTTPSGSRRGPTAGGAPGWSPPPRWAASPTWPTSRSAPTSASRTAPRTHCGHCRRRSHHLCHRLPAGLLRRPVQHRPGPDHPRLRLRLLRLRPHQRHLRDVHLHLLRARGLDHGPGSGARTGHPALDRLRRLHPDGDSAGHLRHEGAGQAAGVDHPAVAGAVGHSRGYLLLSAPGLGGDFFALPAPTATAHRTLPR